MTGITNKGVDTEKKFCRITGFTQMRRGEPKGDAFYEDCDGNRHYVEIKKNTAAQVRAAKFIPLIVSDNDNESVWYVLSPMDQIVYAKNKKRGQHSESAFETCVIHKTYLKNFCVHEKHLRKAVIDCIEKSNTPENREMKALLQEHIVQQSKHFKDTAALIDIVLEKKEQ